MSVTVDHEPLKTDEMGMTTVGHVLSHLQKKNRLVVHVLIDGLEPDLDKLGVVRRSPLSGHAVFIETADPGRMAGEILGEVETQLGEADRLKDEAADLLRKSQWAAAMEKLAGCFSTWQHAQQAILGTAQLLKANLDLLRVNGQPITALLATFTSQLRDIKSALECRDFVALTDLLAYETTETSARWRQAVGALRALVGEPKRT